jgi:demethylmenaquinone methyltransferase/2-methoxy-6-polyprenyl-1,4-benzoquinol methylase
MITTTISRNEARQIYDTLGQDLDRAVRFEQHAKALALDLLAPQPGQQILHVGVGTGAEQARLQAAVEPHGRAIGCDLSHVMLRLTHQRTNTPLCQADVIQLPFARHTFDALFSAYLLDLIPADQLMIALAEFRRVLRPGGKLGLVSMTEGIDLRSWLFVAGWKCMYHYNPHWCGGCRPLQLSGLLWQAGFVTQRSVVVQRGFPSEILIGQAPTR